MATVVDHDIFVRAESNRMFAGWRISRTVATLTAQAIGSGDLPKRLRPRLPGGISLPIAQCAAGRALGYVAANASSEPRSTGSAFRSAAPDRSLANEQPVHLTQHQRTPESAAR